MSAQKNYRVIRSSSQILKETLIKLIIILMVMIVIQLQGCEGVENNHGSSFLEQSESPIKKQRSSNRKRARRKRHKVNVDQLSRAGAVVIKFWKPSSN